MDQATEGNESVLGRLLEELSWAGRSIREYRDGGRGAENVLTAEVLMGLDFLPRQAFLGAVVAGAHGGEAARRALCDEIEEAVVTFLPPEIVLNPRGRSRGEQLIVQPDGVITSPSCSVLVEAKRIRRSSFQPEQLAREYVALTRDAGSRIPLLLLLLGAEPPVPIAGAGRREIEEVIAWQLRSVYERTPDHPWSLATLLDRLPTAYAWITWQELGGIVTEQAGRVRPDNASVAATIDRLAASITRSIRRHA
jgi:hypothetical protein